MEIISYDRENEVLSIKSNTKTVWEYSPISKSVYDEILYFNSSEKIVKNLLRKLPVVGEYKGVYNEFRS